MEDLDKCNLSQIIYHWRGLKCFCSLTRLTSFSFRVCTRLLLYNRLIDASVTYFGKSRAISKWKSFIRTKIQSPERVVALFVYLTSWMIQKLYTVYISVSRTSNFLQKFNTSNPTWITYQGISSSSQIAFRYSLYYRLVQEYRKLIRVSMHLHRVLSILGSRYRDFSTGFTVARSVHRYSCYYLRPLLLSAYNFHDFVVAFAIFPIK